MTDKYTTNKNNYFKELKKRWKSADLTYSKGLAEKNLINQYIHFLSTSEGYPNAEIARVVGVSRERIGAIVMNVTRALEKNKKGGETS